MEEKEVSKKLLKRRRQRARQKEKKRLARTLKEPEETKPETMESKQPEKSKEQIQAERKAKKAAKKQSNKKEEIPAAPAAKSPPPKVENQPNAAKTPPTSAAAAPIVKQEPVQSDNKPKQEAEKSREEVKAEREAKKLAKLAAKKKTTTESENTQQPQKPEQSVDKSDVVAKTSSDSEIAQKLENLHISEDAKKTGSSEQTDNKENKPASKAERRALQEAQRAQKAKLQADKAAKIAAIKKSAEVKETKAKAKPEVKKAASASHPGVISQKSTSLHKVRLFKHLYTEKGDLNIKVNSRFHTEILRLGAQYANNTVVGCNSRCYAFLNAMQILIRDFETPQEKAFSRALETEIQMSVEFLHKCRPLAVSASNALKYIKLIVSQENSSDNDDQKKARIIEKIRTYAHEQIETAARAISLKVKEKISDDDVILTFGCSSLIKRTLIESWKCGEKKFSVVVVDSRPDYEGQEMLEALTREGICCTYVLINAISFIMPKVTKVLLGAHALLANGYVMSRVGTAQISMVANFFNVPVLVCCETHKFSERVQTDSFVYNEIGDPNALVVNKNSMEPYDHLKDWQSNSHLTPLNLRYDITPPELVTAVVTEIALLPCTSVQVILRVKPSE